MGQRRVIKPADERRKELIDAARALFMEQGYEQTTMSNIAERANVAQGTFYIYFSSKQDVLLAIMRELLEALGEIIRGLAERTDLPAPAVLRQAMADCFTLVRQESRLVEAVYLQANYSLPAQLVEHSAPMLLPVITSIIERGVREGSLRVTHPRIAADFLWTAGYRLFEIAAQQQIASGKGAPVAPETPSFAALEQAFTEFIAHGLGVQRI
ncbi:MAG TPA: TetR/AcrR family transcriptional regulator [Symbiobacteriaceae bacterium]|nr:TetR/AcrR family transcriptional regulator [Symbiobacteriaceae bacterium]